MRPRVALLLPGLLGAAAAQCWVVDDPLGDIVVDDARIENVTLSNIAAIAGGGRGACDLVVDDTDGVRHRFPSSLQTKELGLALDGSVLFAIDADFPFALEPGAFAARDLVGVYHGPHLGAEVVLGGHWRGLRRDYLDIELSVLSLSAGAGVVPFSWEELDLELVDDPIGRREVDVGAASECAVDADCVPTGQCNVITGLCESTVQRPARGTIDRAPQGPPTLPPPR